jgi:hypothetical protein
MSVSKKETPGNVSWADMVARLARLRRELARRDEGGAAT